MRRGGRSLERALAGEEVTYEVEFPRRGGVAFTEVVHVPHRDARGDVLGVYVIVTDVTQHKLSERAIAESEARFRAIANSAPVLIWVTGADGRREFVNQAYLDYFGGDYEETLAFDWRRALHPDDLPRILQEAPSVDPSTKLVTVEARFRRGDGEWRWLRAESQPRWTIAGEHAGFIGVAHDVTAAKQAQQALAEINETLEHRVEERTAALAASEALVTTFFQHSPECHVVLVEDGDGFRFQEINPATLALYGKTRAEVVGRLTDDVLGAELGGRGQWPHQGLPAQRRRLSLRAHSGRPHDRSRRDAGAVPRRRAAPGGGQRPRRQRRGGGSRNNCARR